jgi:hypothetical protein
MGLAYGALAADRGQGRRGNEPQIESTPFFKSKAKEI